LPPLPAPGSRLAEEDAFDEWAPDEMRVDAAMRGVGSAAALRGALARLIRQRASDGDEDNIGEQPGEEEAAFRSLIAAHAPPLDRVRLAACRDLWSAAFTTLRRAAERAAGGGRPQAFAAMRYGLDLVTAAAAWLRGGGSLPDDASMAFWRTMAGLGDAAVPVAELDAAIADAGGVALLRPAARGIALLADRQRLAGFIEMARRAGDAVAAAQSGGPAGDAPAAAGLVEGLAETFILDALMPAAPFARAVLAAADDALAEAPPAFVEALGRLFGWRMVAPQLLDAMIDGGRASAGPTTTPAIWSEVGGSAIAAFAAHGWPQPDDLVQP
jgi:hypothetical protein